MFEVVKGWHLSRSNSHSDCHIHFNNEQTQEGMREKNKQKKTTLSSLPSEGTLKTNVTYSVACVCVIYSAGRGRKLNSGIQNKIPKEEGGMYFPPGGQ